MKAPRRILVVGAGGREHALAWRLALDPHAPEVLLAPGPHGAMRFERILGDGTDADALAAACHARGIELVVVGPEAPLAAGLVDALQAAGLHVFGPSRAAARLESSKAFAKACMRRAGIPTARAETVTDPARLGAVLRTFEAPFVVKADGLAAGKGVLVTPSFDEAVAFGEACLAHDRFGASGSTVVIEAFMEGAEVSVMAVCDGERPAILPPARDHKRARDGDQGPNTGGMGAFAPAPGWDAAGLAGLSRSVFEPLLDLMRRDGTPFRGVLYAGLMLGPRGPHVLEFNVRFGDPETQVVLPLVAGSLSGLLLGAARGAMDPALIAPARGAAAGIALVDEGYPERGPGAGWIEGLDALEGADGLLVFHAATRPDPRGWAVAGGRAAYVVGLDASLEAARLRAYTAIDSLGGRGWRYRHDIGGAAFETPAQIIEEGGG